MTAACFNGELVAGPISISPRDRGLQLGDGLFETMLVVDGTPVWRDRHLARLLAAASELGFACDRVAIERSMSPLLARAGQGNSALRVQVTRGAGPRGLSGAGEPNILATLEPLNADFMLKPARLVTSAIRRNATAPSSRLKTLSYIDAIAATRDALARGADDALMLNTSGFVASGPVANLFLLTGRELVTPSLDQAILPGITRRVILDLAPSLGLAAAERPIALAELADADAVFASNSLRLLRPLIALDGSALGGRDLGFIAEALCQAIAAVVGRDPRLP